MSSYIGLEEYRKDYESHLGIIRGLIDLNTKPLSQKVKELESRIEELQQALDGEIGTFYENMDFDTMAVYAAKCDRKITKLREALEFYASDKYMGDAIYNDGEVSFGGDVIGICDIAKTALEECFGEDE